MPETKVTSRQAFRRTEDYSPGAARVKLVTEGLPLPLHPLAVLIKVHAVSLNYRDANISNGNNPWPVIPKGIPCNDAAGEIIDVGESVTTLKVGDRVAPITDTEYITGREPGRSWLAADEDGVLANYVVFDERKVCKLPDHLDWLEASIIPCAACTAWSSVKGVGTGKSILIQGTGGVSMCALKFARAAGLRVILTSSNDDKLDKLKKQFPDPPISTINYSKIPEWHEEVLKLTGGLGVDVVVEVGGAKTLMKSMKCTKRGGIVSQVGYLSGEESKDLAELFGVIIDRRVVLRGINAASKYDMDDLIAAISATNMRFDDIIDSTYPFEKADEAIEYLWQGKQVGKVIITLP